MSHQSDMEFQWVGGATWILTVDGVKIACDPVLCPAGTIQDYGWFRSVTMGQGRCSLYVTGDTVTAAPVLQALHGRSVDVLIPNMGAAKPGSWIMCLTLSANMLRMLKERLGPQVTIPVHFGTFEHYVEPIAKVAAWHDETIRILAPGQRCPLEA